MKILFIEPYYGGSHKAFADSWAINSRFDFEIMALPPNKWKWRMRHAAVYFAEKFKKISQTTEYNCIFCSDMLNLAEFIGLTSKTFHNVPKIVYFHENQLTYPQRFESQRDYQYVMTNFTTALAADKVIFNSKFHRDQFLEQLVGFFKKMPDNPPLEQIEQIKINSEIIYPGINPIIPRKNKNETLKILWAARWEHDKNPEDFFRAMKILKDKNYSFKLNVIGEQFRDSPEIFDWAKKYFADNIEIWGYQPDKQSYQRCLQKSDIVVSTAEHEFYGIGMLEALSAGCYPLLPNRLSYPELLGDNWQFLYDGSPEDLANRLEKLINNPDKAQNHASEKIAEKFTWKNQGQKLDQAVLSVLKAKA